MFNEVWELGSFKSYWIQVITFPPNYDQQIQAYSMFVNDVVTENSQEVGHT
jgi:hypothetical protein